MFSLFCLGLFFSCASTSPEAERESLPSWPQRYRNNPSEVRQALQQLQDPIERETIILSIVDAFPNQSQALCKQLRSKVAITRCQRFQQRPHLWTIQPKNSQKTGWISGYLGERLFFPQDFQIPLFKAGSSPQCPNRSLSACIEERVMVAAKEGKATEVSSLCLLHRSARSIGDCFFAASEKISIDKYSQAVLLCAQSGSFAPECHNHIILRAATDNWVDQKKHRNFVAQIHHQWADVENYAKDLESVYWSTVAARVAGMMQPFARTDFMGFPPVFQAHLRSAIALRVIHQKDPLATAKRVWEGGEITSSQSSWPQFTCISTSVYLEDKPQLFMDTFL